MPWRKEPKKDVAGCEKPRGAASGHRSGDIRMGEPGTGRTVSSTAEHIGRERVSGGTETSKYPEEKKSNEIPQVAASERGGAQTRRV